MAKIRLGCRWLSVTNTLAYFISDEGKILNGINAFKTLFNIDANMLNKLECFLQAFQSGVNCASKATLSVWCPFGRLWLYSEKLD